MSKAVIVVGVAGSGKTWTTMSIGDWFKGIKQDVYLVNLDPGADNIPYKPAFDIRDYIDLWRVMNEYGLGPNGGLIAAMDLMINYLSELNKFLREVGNSLVVIDTPGQLEIFLFRPSGKILLDALDVDEALILYIIDSVFAREPRNLVSSMLLSGILKIRFDKPILAVLNKIDMIERSELNKLLKIISRPNLLKKVLDERYVTFESDLLYRLLYLLKKYDVASDFIPISSMYLDNFDSLIRAITRILYGGEEFFS